MYSKIKCSLSHTHMHAWQQAPTMDHELKITTVCTLDLTFIYLLTLDKFLHLPEPTCVVRASAIMCAYLW